MKLTLQLKLVPTPEQHTALLETMRAFNAAASYAAEVGFAAHVWGQPSIHLRCYRELRDRFGLSSQMAVRAIGKAVEAFKRDKTVCPVFRPDGAMTYDERLLGWKGPAHVSLLTLHGREIVAMVYGEYQAGFLQRLKGQVDLVYRDGTFYLYATIEVPEDTPIAPTHFLGVDLGIVNIATDSDGNSYTGDAIEVVRQRTSTARQTYQSTHTKSAKRRLKKMAGRQARFQRAVNHSLSKRLVAYAKDTKAALVLEELTHIRDRLTVRRAQRSKQHNWSLARNWDRHQPQSEGLQLFENYDAFMVTGQQNTTTCNREGSLPMSIGFSGLDTPCCMQPVTIEVSPSHPLIQLAQAVPWQALADMVLPDLKRTTAQGKWWRGRKLTLRIHLGALLLQWLYHLTDRQVEWAIKDNAAYQLFCGRGGVTLWHAPDHTKIEEFRSRLSPETQRQAANAIAVWATRLGFADPSTMDIDSTVQEANIAYPSDAHLMVKMTLLVHKVWTYMKQNIAFFIDFLPNVDVKAVKAKARAYWFRDHKKVEETPRLFQDLWHEACTQINHVRQYFPILLEDDIDRMPWNIRRAFDQINVYCSDLFLNVASFMCRGVMVPDKAVSFHAQAVSCFNKGKLSKGLQFGRAFQLGRIGGNFLLVGACTSLRMEDKASVRPMIAAHQGLFGQGVLQSFGTDKGYYSRTNNNYLRAVAGLEDCGLQQPGLDIGSLTESEAETRACLADRRAGIEPLIGHAKQGGQLGQSRMKTDDTTLAAGYSAIGGFNLRQLIRHLLGKDIKPMG